MRLAFLSLVLLAGCTTTATITTQGRRSVEAAITGGDATNLFVTTEAGLTTSIPRADVLDIDHPGNVVAVVGGVLAGSAGLDLVVLSQSQPRLPTGVTAMFGGMAAAGAGMLVWGLWTWIGSRRAVEPPPDAVPQPVPSTGPPLPAGPPPPVLVPEEAPAPLPL